MRLDFWRDSSSAVANFNHDVAIVAEGPEPQFSLAEHGFNGVFDDVGPKLVYFRTDGVHKNWYRPIIPWILIPGCNR